MESEKNMERIRQLQQKGAKKREEKWIKEGFDWREEIVEALLEDVSDQIEILMNNEMMASLYLSLSKEEREQQVALARARLDAYRGAIETVNYYADLYARHEASMAKTSNQAKE